MRNEDDHRETRWGEGRKRKASWTQCGVTNVWWRWKVVEASESSNSPRWGILLREDIADERCRRVLKREMLLWLEHCGCFLLFPEKKKDPMIRMIKGNIPSRWFSENSSGKILSNFPPLTLRIYWRSFKVNYGESAFRWIKFNSITSKSLPDDTNAVDVNSHNALTR